MLNGLEPVSAFKISRNDVSDQARTSATRSRESLSSTSVPSFLRMIPKFLVFIILNFLLLASARAQVVDSIRIEKSERRMKLMSGESVVQEYKVALGSEPLGAKRCQGDGQTPEGEYVISGRNSASSFHLSLRVSYPSEEDKKKAQELGCQPGGDIMIHGLPRLRGWLGAAHRAMDWTQGCIAVTNGEIEEIWRLVPNGTRVLISP